MTKDNIVCSVEYCENIGVQIYDLFSNKPHFMRLFLCKEHSEEANKELFLRKLKVKIDGTYERINYCSDCKKSIPLEDTHCRKCFLKHNQKYKGVLR